MTRVGLLIEMDGGRVKETSLGMITLAARAADTDLYALMLDGVDDAAVDTLTAYGVTTVMEVVLPADSLMRQHPAVRAEAVCRAVKTLHLNRLMGLSSAGEKEVLARIAARLDLPLVMDCVDVDLDRGIGRTSQYSGKVLADIALTGDLLMFGVQPNAVKPAPSIASVTGGAADRRTITPAVSMPDDLALISVSEGDVGSRVSLSEADIIVAGGRGMKNGDNFALLFACAEKMNAAVGASRVAVDEGWIPYAHQVGQTGEKVNPSVYIACGISGSIQHFAGMKTAKMIIAVNKDPNAAIMANCDYYVHGDLFEILPELTRRL